MLLDLFLGLDWQSYDFDRYGVWSRKSICTIWRNTSRYCYPLSIYFSSNFYCLHYTLSYFVFPDFCWWSTECFFRKYILFDGVLQDRAQTILISSYCWQGTLNYGTMVNGLWVKQDISYMHRGMGKQYFLWCWLPSLFNDSIPLLWYEMSPISQL